MIGEMLKINKGLKNMILRRILNFTELMSEARNTQ